VNNAAKIVMSTNKENTEVSWLVSEATPPPTEGMSKPHSNQTNVLKGVSVIAVIAAVAYGGLWLSERERDA
jgi:hypothetical protein